MLARVGEGEWTPTLVGAELIDALRWAHRAGGKVGPAGYRSAMPALAMRANERELEAWLGVQELEPEPMRRGYSPFEISRMERVLCWLRYFDATVFDGNDEFAMTVFRAWVHCKIQKRAKFEKMCSQMGWSRATAYRYRDRILAQIAQGLTRDRIERGRH